MPVFYACDCVRRTFLPVRPVRKRVCSRLLADLLAGACEPFAQATIEAHRYVEVTHTLSPA